MRNVILLAGALGALAFSTAYAADPANTRTDDPAYGTVTPAVENAQAMGVWASDTTPPPAMRVMGLLTKEEVSAMRDAHAKAGLTLSLSVVPAGGINAGKYFVTGNMTPDEMAAMEAAHQDAGLQLNMRAMPLMPMPGVVMGETRMRPMDADVDNDMDNDNADNGGDGDNDADDYGRHASNAGTQWMQPPAGGAPGMMPPPPGDPGDWYGGNGRGDGGREMWRGHGGMRGGRGWRGHGGPNYDVAEKCGHWEQDWQQDGCGIVHVHNLADWLPGHPGWAFGWPYAGWDDDSWPHVRGDGSAGWYTGAWWASHDIKVTPPAWFDAQWAMFGDAYPDTWWISTWQQHGWRGGWGRDGWHGKGCCGR
jgi:hypothetical protein